MSQHSQERRILPVRQELIVSNFKHTYRATSEGAVRCLCIVICHWYLHFTSILNQRYINLRYTNMIWQCLCLNCWIWLLDLTVKSSMICALSRTADAHWVWNPNETNQRVCCFALCGAIRSFGPLTESVSEFRWLTRRSNSESAMLVKEVTLIQSGLANLRLMRGETRHSQVTLGSGLMIRMNQDSPDSTGH